MGVPKFYRWLSERYPLINQMLSSSAVLPEFDNLYLDMNGIIHACSHPNDHSVSSDLTERDIMWAIFRYIDRIVSEIVKPQRVLFMAIDGVAPRAKLNQQRARRFRSAQDRVAVLESAKERGEVVDESTIFDSNCITPGTSFMDRVSQHIRWFIRKKVKEDPLWRRLTIVFSGHEVPGEGEHKIMEWIRDYRASTNYIPNTRHCMYGQDADLIMLGLATHEPHFALLREVINFNFNRGNGRRGGREVMMRQTKEAQFQLLHISLLREYLSLDLGHDLEYEVDTERLMDDFIFLTFLVGNDFLPHLPTLDISEHAFDLLIGSYRKLFNESPGYLVLNGEIGDWDRLEKLFALIGTEEQSILIAREKNNFALLAKRQRYAAAEAQDAMASMILNENEKATKYKKALAEAMGIVQEETNEDLELDLDLENLPTAPTWDSETKDFRGRYYFEKFGLLTEVNTGAQSLHRLMGEYMRGLLWCLAYYMKGCVSWTWYYPYHYGPMLQDMRNLQSHSSMMAFDLGAPFTPFQQLLGCLPPASSNFLPKSYAWLMTSEDSPVRHFYPDDFAIDMDGKKAPWEAVVLLDFIDEKILLAAEAEYCPRDRLTPQERARNSFGMISTVVYDPAVQTTYLSPCPENDVPDVPHCHSREETSTFSLSPGHYFVAELMPGTVFPIAGYPSLTMLSLAGVKITPLSVNVFGAPSRYRTLELTVDGAQNMSSLSLTQLSPLLGRSVFVNFPQVHEARVVGISTVEGDWRWVDIAGGDAAIPTDVAIRALESVRGTAGEALADASRETVHRHNFTAAEAKRWIGQSALHTEKNLSGCGTPGMGGLSIGDVAVRLRVRPLQGVRRDPVTGATVKVFSRTLEAEVPIQLALLTPPVVDTRFAETGEIPLEKMYPIGSEVVAVESELRGCVGVVVGPHSVEGKVAIPPGAPRVVDVMFNVPIPSPPFGYAISRSVRDTYYSARDVCQLLRISPSVLGKVVGSLRVEPLRADLGLNLKRNGAYQLLGYVRRVDTAVAEDGRMVARSEWATMEAVHVMGVASEDAEVAGAAATKESVYWEYSAAAVTLLAEYKARFSRLFSALERLPHTPVYQAFDLFGENAAATVTVLLAWMEEQPFFHLPRTPFSTASLSRPAIAAIERAADVYSARVQADGGSVKHHVRSVPVEKLFSLSNHTVHDVALPYNPLEPRMGDRIANLASPGVPLGLRGTVVTVHRETRYVEVVFDTEWVGGKNLAGNCSAFRGRLVNWSDLILLSGVDEFRDGVCAPADPITSTSGKLVKTITPAATTVGKGKAAKVDSSKKLLGVLKKDSELAGKSPSTVPVKSAAAKSLLAAVKASPPAVPPAVPPAAPAVVVDTKLAAMSLLAAVKGPETLPPAPAPTAAAVTSPTPVFAKAATVFDDDVDDSVDAMLDVDADLDLSRFTAKPSKGTARSLLASAAGVDADSDASLLPTPQSIYAMYPHMAVGSYIPSQIATGVTLTSTLGISHPVTSTAATAVEEAPSTSPTEKRSPRTQTTRKEGHNGNKSVKAPVKILTRKENAGGELLAKLRSGSGKASPPSAPVADAPVSPVADAPVSPVADAPVSPVADAPVADAPSEKVNAPRKDKMAQVRERLLAAKKNAKSPTE